MKKKLFFSSLFIFITFLNATVLIDYYHKDYLIADRSVFVFDEKPQYTLSKENSKILLKMINTQKDIDIENQKFSDGKVISDIDYLVSGTQLSATINLFKSNFDNPQIEKFGYYENKNIYKVVVDIIGQSNPTTASQAKDLANFYKFTGREKKAKSILVNFEKKSKAVQVSKNQKVETLPKIEKKEIAPLLKSEPESTEITFKDKITKIISRYNLSFYLIVFAGFLLFLFGIRILRNILKKEKIIDDPSFYSVNEFGSLRFRKTVAQKFQDLNWDIESIARELQITVQDTKKILEDSQI